MECSTREGLWYDPVRCLQNQRGENQYEVNFSDMKWSHVITNAKIPSYQYQMTYDLYIAAFAGAGITLLALVSVYFNTGSSLVQNKRVMAHVTKWRSKCRQRGISGLHDWWLLYYCSLFLFVSWHKHHNNAVMSGPVPVMQGNDAPIIVACFIAEAVMGSICYQVKAISTIMFWSSWMLWAFLHFICFWFFVFLFVFS